MGDLPFAISGNLGEGAVQEGNEEKGIVAEAIYAPGCGEELAPDGTYRAEENLAVAGEGNGADKAGRPVNMGLELEEEGEVVALVFGSEVGLEVEVVGEAGGADTGSAVEGGGFEAGVVSKDEEAGCGEGVGARFLLGVAHEGGSVFGRCGHGCEGGEREHAEVAAADARGGRCGDGRGELGQLARVGGGGVENHDLKLHGISSHTGSQATWDTRLHAQRHAGLWHPTS